MFDTRNTSAPWTTLKGPKSSVLALQYDPKSGKIVTGGTNNRVTVWHARTGGDLYSIKMPGVGNITVQTQTQYILMNRNSKRIAV